MGRVRSLYIIRFITKELRMKKLLSLVIAGLMLAGVSVEANTTKQAAKRAARANTKATSKSATRGTPGVAKTEDKAPAQKRSWAFWKKS